MLALAAGPTLPGVGVPAEKPPRPAVAQVQVQVPPVPVPKVRVPPVRLPDLPDVQLPPQAKPPVVPPVATPIAPPAAPTSSTPTKTAPETTTTPAAPSGGPAGEGSGGPAHERGRDGARDRARGRRRDGGRDGTGARGRRADRAVTGAPEDTTRFAAAATPTAAPRPTATAHPAAPDEATPPGIAGDVLDLVEALPAAILWSIVGIAAVALALAARAFRLGRQRTALELQRGMLLDDIGLLSQALLPPVPELDGLAVSAAYRPADGPAAGGDFYDVFKLDDDRVGVLLGDVSGHGRDSVTIAALARYTLRTLLAAGHGPGAALAEADRLLERELPPRFVTVIAAVYDPRTTRLTYAKAGHAPPIVIGAPHDPNAETPACPIGVGLGTDWPEYHVDLADGVSVCLVTDGLEEARRAGTRLGRAEVERLVAAQERPDAACLLQELGTIADQVSDDTAAVVVARA
jgi:Stage II sporulation protein E (SpoIIE)